MEKKNKKKKHVPNASDCTFRKSGKYMFMVDSKEFSLNKDLSIVIAKCQH